MCLNYKDLNYRSLNYLYSLFLTKFQTEILQSELLNLSATCHRKLIHKENIFRYFVTGNLVSAKVTYILRLYRDRSPARSGLTRSSRRSPASPAAPAAHGWRPPAAPSCKMMNAPTASPYFLEGIPATCTSFTPSSFIKVFFYFTRVNIFSTADNHILDTSVMR